MPHIFRPNERQAEFIKSDARFAAFIGGVGSGKTASGAVKAVTKINSGEDGAILAPDFPQFVKSTWPEFLKWAPMSRCINSELDHPFTTKKQLKFDLNGKIVTVYYGGIEKEEGWAGLNLNWVWFDEAARKRTRKAFDVLSARIRVGYKPQIFITTTPSGMQHWLYEVFVAGEYHDNIIRTVKESGYEGRVIHAVHAPTWMNKENLDAVYYASLVGSYTGRYAEEQLMGLFVAMDGLVWEEFSSQEEKGNVTLGAEYVPGVPVEWWVDDGFTRGHPRVILFAQVIPPYVNVFDEEISLYTLPEESITNALEKGYPKPDVAYVDSAAAEIRNRIWQMEIDTVKASHNVEEGIKRTASWIKDALGTRHLRFHPRCTFSIKEISNYFRSDDSSKPIKDSDNAADAVRYGLWYKDREEIWGDDEFKERVGLVSKTPTESVVEETSIDVAKRAGLPVVDYKTKEISLPNGMLYNLSNMDDDRFEQMVFSFKVQYHGTIKV